VIFYVDDNKLATVTSEPYTWTWRREGLTQHPPHHIDVCAIDSLGHQKYATLDNIWKFF
jgi:hypothetical protein